MNYHKEFTKAKIMLAETDVMSPEVHVDGLGTYDLKTLKQSTRRNIAQLELEASSDNAHAWRQVKHLLDNGVIQAKVDAIVAAHDDLQAKRRKGGPSSRGIEKE
jgi:hypothetical protein